MEIGIDNQFYGFKFFCPTERNEEAIGVLRQSRGVCLWPYSVLTSRTIIEPNGLVRVRDGVTLFGICFQNRVNSVAYALAERKIAAYDDESLLQVVRLDRHTINEDWDLGNN